MPQEGVMLAWPNHTLSKVSESEYCSIESSNISKNKEDTPTKIGFYAVYIKLYLHEFLSRFYYLTPPTLDTLEFLTTPTYIGYFYRTSPGNLQQLSHTLLLNVTADFVHSLTCHECPKVYNEAKRLF